MKYLVFALLVILSVFELKAQNGSNDPATIRKQMATIRQSTNWDSAEEAKKANALIRELSKKLLQGKGPVLPQNANDENTPDPAEAKLQMFDQILASARQGEGADILLGEPVRKEIVEEYKDDESPVIKNSQFLEEMTFLCIDLSLPSVQRTIDQMENYQSIKVLVITGGKNGADVNLPDLFKKAAHYPLTDLYIINFKQKVTTIPQTLERFKNLTTLSVMNNHLSSLPPAVKALASLKNLYLDINPVTTLAPEINFLKGLEILGVGKTCLSAEELDRLKIELTNCQILEK